MKDNQFAHANVGWALCPKCGGRKRFIHHKDCRCPTCQREYTWQEVMRDGPQGKLACGHDWGALHLESEVVFCPECGGTGLRG